MPVKILIVDDELDLQDLMKRKFRREIRHGEFSLDFATDGQSALDKVRADTEIVSGSCEPAGAVGTTFGIPLAAVLPVSVVCLKAASNSAVDAYLSSGLRAIARSITLETPPGRPRE